MLWWIVLGVVVVLAVAWALRSRSGRSGGVNDTAIHRPEDEPPRGFRSGGASF